MTLNARQVITLFFAIGFAGVGVWLAVRAVAPAGARSTAAADAGDAEQEWERYLASLPNFSRAVNPDLDVDVTPGDVDRVAADLRDRVSSLARATPEVSALGVRAVDALADAAHDRAMIYFSGDFDRHWAFLERTGAYNNVYREAASDEERAEVRRGLRSLFESLTAPYAHKPISLDNITVRLRFRDGTGAPHPDDAYVVGMTTRPCAWPEYSGDPRANRLTVVEVMIPIFYVDDEQNATPVHLGIWFVYDAADHTWKINQTRVYNPLMATHHILIPSY